MIVIVKAQADEERYDHGDYNAVANVVI